MDQAMTRLERTAREASPEVRKELEAANSALRHGNYRSAIGRLQGVAAQQPLSFEQRRAIGQAVGETLQAVQQHSEHRDDPELYYMMNNVIKMTLGEN